MSNNRSWSLIIGVLIYCCCSHWTVAILISDAMIIATPQPAIMSVGQCTQTATLLIDITIEHAISINHIDLISLFLRWNQIIVTVSHIIILTAAWSDGNDAVGNSLRIRWIELSHAKIGLSLWRNDWSVILTTATYTAEANTVNESDLCCLLFLIIPIMYHTTNSNGYAKTNISAKIGTSLTNVGELNVIVLRVWMSDCHRWGSRRFISTRILVKLEYLTNRTYIYIIIIAWIDVLFKT